MNFEVGNEYGLRGQDLCWQVKWSFNGVIVDFQRRPGFFVRPLQQTKFDIRN